jgi:hypothetical protein
VIPSIARGVKAGVPFLLTAGDLDGVRTQRGQDERCDLYAFFLSRDSYRRILLDHGFQLMDVHTDRGDTCDLAQKIWKKALILAGHPQTGHGWSLIAPAGTTSPFRIGNLFRPWAVAGPQEACHA